MGCGEVYTKLEIICYIVSVIVIGLGVVIYRKAEKTKIQSDYSKMELNADDGLINKLSADEHDKSDIR